MKPSRAFANSSCPSQSCPSPPAMTDHVFPPSTVADRRVVGPFGSMVKSQPWRGSANATSVVDPAEQLCSSTRPSGRHCLPPFEVRYKETRSLPQSHVVAHPCSESRKKSAPMRDLHRHTCPFQTYRPEPCGPVLT